MNAKQKVLDILSEYGFITKPLAQENGINNLEDNIYKLRKQGYKIKKVCLKYWNGKVKIEQNYYESC